MTDPPPSPSTQSFNPEVVSGVTTTQAPLVTQEPVIIESVPYFEAASTLPTPKTGRNQQAVVVASSAPSEDPDTTNEADNVKGTEHRETSKAKKGKSLVFDDYDFDGTLSKDARRKFSENFLKNLKSRKNGKEKKATTPRPVTAAPTLRVRGRRPSSEAAVEITASPLLAEIPESTLEPATFVDSNEIVKDVPTKDSGGLDDQDPAFFIQPVFTNSAGEVTDFPQDELSTTTTTTSRPVTARRTQAFTFQSFRTTESTINDIQDTVTQSVPIRHNVQNSIPDDLDAEVIAKARQDSYIKQQQRQKQVQNQLIELQRETQNLQLILQQKQHQNLLLVESLRDRFDKDSNSDDGSPRDDSTTTSERTSRQVEVLDSESFQDIFNAVSNEEFGRRANPRAVNQVSENLVDSVDPGQPEMVRVQFLVKRQVNISQKCAIHLMGILTVSLISMVKMYPDHL